MLFDLKPTQLRSGQSCVFPSRRSRSTSPLHVLELTNRGWRPSYAVAIPTCRATRLFRATSAGESEEVSGVDLSIDERGHSGDRERDDPVLRSVDETLSDQRGARRAQARWLPGQACSDLAG